jgi:hypothetical protein
LNWKTIGSVAVVPAVLFGSLHFVIAQIDAAQMKQPENGSRVEPALSCSPERPTVWPRERIHASVWIRETGRPVAYTWSVTGGQVIGQGSDITWDFAGVRPGAYTASVKVTGAGDTPSNCSLQVIVLERGEGRGVPHLTGRSLLVGDMKETEGYGLYSYLLFSNPPDQSSRDRYKRAVEAYVSLMPDVLSLEKYLKPGELNITYIPVDADAPKSISADWILEHYNYARALVLMKAVPGSRKDGPYLISSLAPLTGKERFTEQYLFQDMSSVPPNLVSVWVKQFLNQASQEHFWEPRSGTLLALRLRTAIGILAVGLPDVQNALNGWISWRRSASGS